MNTNFMPNQYQKTRENANVVFLKVDEGIYQVIKDRNGKFSGRVYVNTDEVIDELNQEFKVAIIVQNGISEYVLHRNF